MVKRKKTLPDANTRSAPIDGRHMGVDVARFGTDENVAVLLVDGLVQDMRSWSGQDLMATAGRVRHLMAEWRVEGENVHVDVIGVGGGVVDRLREDGVLVDGVKMIPRLLW